MARTVPYLLMVLLVCGCLPKRMTVSKSTGGALTQPPPIVIPKEPPPESRLKLANRTQLGSILTSIFGPSVQAVTDSMIVNNGFHFGGACDGYSADLACGAGTLPNPVPLPITSREALLSRICERIASTDPAIQYAVQQMAPTIDPALVRPAPSDILKSYDLFFPDAPAPAVVVTKLKGVVEATQTNGFPPFEAWRFLLLSECLMPEWQVL